MNCGRWPGGSCGCRRWMRSNRSCWRHWAATASVDGGMPVTTADVTRVEKPWGYELHWAKTERYVGKLIHVNAGHALSLQYHNQKDETIFLWAGRMLFEIAPEPLQDAQAGTAGPLTRREMKAGEAVHVTPKTVHRMT